MVNAIICESHKVANIKRVYFCLIVDVKAIVSLAKLIDFVLELGKVRLFSSDFACIVQYELILFD